MVVYSPTAEASRGLSHEVILKIGEATSGSKEQLSIKGLREQLVEVDSRVFSAKPQAVLASDPTEGIDKGVVVLGLVLIGWGSGADLKASQRKLVDGMRQVAGGSINTQSFRTNRRSLSAWIGAGRQNVHQAVVDPY